MTQKHPHLHRLQPQRCCSRPCGWAGRLPAYTRTRGAGRGVPAGTAIRAGDAEVVAFANVRAVMDSELRRALDADHRSGVAQGPADDERFRRRRSRETGRSRRDVRRTVRSGKARMSSEAISRRASLLVQRHRSIRRASSSSSASVAAAWKSTTGESCSRIRTGPKRLPSASCASDLIAIGQIESCAPRDRHLQRQREGIPQHHDQPRDDDPDSRQLGQHRVGRRAVRGRSAVA